MKVLVTGGAGFIGSTTCSALEDAGHTPVVLDSLVSGPEAFTRGRLFYHGDMADTALVRRIFAEHPDIAATLHFAARIVVTESVAQPALYYRENVVGSLTLFETLLALGQTRVIFSSSASIYDSPADLRVDEHSPLKPLSPYARSKRMTEEMLGDLCAASQTTPTPMRAIALRYFNPVGADPKLRSGPYIADPTHILGRLMAAAQGRAEAFEITGTDYATRDGTGLRDYIHIWDLAQAHVAALEGFDGAFEAAAREGRGQVSFLPINVGSGNGVTVRELVTAFKEASPTPVTVREGPRRPGDSAGAYADTTRARDSLGWKAQLTVAEAMQSAFAWEAVRGERLNPAATQERQFQP
ncbi:UDP-glucose 4-epimerase GalE [Deinococcus radiopugnans]|uniref:UDP-glucose 4-epimerase n=1 Tax=Deinococcus radiopugnans ATCC 19172 TaxID=585398 RepID=A0A5C4Y6K0_9DEIO|nr:UDP-glucose 4-epimerase GalE [Deinococcus radiopugnans]MBB6017753.1 UDP-glucose 4-epimerase [Deinococcus radiopugnans ATCC 19172]TNM71442.1 UDP-glucose 4-epimerase GalE [Deinococcus radiopugnans ATCC 19172]